MTGLDHVSPSAGDAIHPALHAGAGIEIKSLGYRELVWLVDPYQIAS